MNSITLYMYIANSIQVFILVPLDPNHIHISIFIKHID